MYYLDVLTTGQMTPIEDVRDAIRAYERCELECQLSNDDGDIIAEKMFTDDGDNIILEDMNQFNSVGYDDTEKALC